MNAQQRQEHNSLGKRGVCHLLSTDPGAKHAAERCEVKEWQALGAAVSESLLNLVTQTVQHLCLMHSVLGGQKRANPNKRAEVEDGRGPGSHHATRHEDGLRTHSRAQSFGKFLDLVVVRNCGLYCGKALQQEQSTATLCCNKALDFTSHNITTTQSYLLCSYVQLHTDILQPTPSWTAACWGCDSLLA